MTTNILSKFTQHASLSRLISVAAVSASLVLGACSSLGLQTPQGQATQRANARWQALVASQFDLAYSYNTPGFRALVTPETYRGRIGSAVKWVSAEVSKVNCPQADKCDVQIKLNYKPILGGRAGDTYATYLDESWLLEDGQWWIYQPLK